MIDDKILEVDWEGNILWSWKTSDHFDELGFDEAAKNALYKNPSVRGSIGGDWMHVNNIALVGPNKWFDAGDKRFAPENIIFDARNTNILAIISRETGKIVWRVGPDYSATKELQKLGWIIGQHHLHIIPKGLPGEGNMLVFDNGGHAGYGTPNPASLTGVDNASRDYSRVLEFNPQTLEIVWQYTPEEAGSGLFSDPSKFFSSYISSAQRLPNGNTLITEGSDGRLIEVTNDHKIVWEFINPYFKSIFGRFTNNGVYRAYRVPYEWIPQLEKPNEHSVVPIDVQTFRVPGSDNGIGNGQITTVEGIDPDRIKKEEEKLLSQKDAQVHFCTVTLRKDKLK